MDDRSSRREVRNPIPLAALDQGKAERRGYAKGYAAGRRRAANEYSRDLADWRREQFRQRAALLVLQQMMLPGNAWAP